MPVLVQPIIAIVSHLYEFAASVAIIGGQNVLLWETSLRRLYMAITLFRD